jgi:hypothetical protein
VIPPGAGFYDQHEQYLKNAPYQASPTRQFGKDKTPGPGQGLSYIQPEAVKIKSCLRAHRSLGRDSERGELMEAHVKSAQIKFKNS